ncbi:OOP family OmpA-OmpF porin [Rhodoblastus acidophilus]|uniref:OmpA family protein n=1 Tax=Rhodoblastus acidophilus TaxID=1074 RepID=UPI00222514A5|nr:OmpA family protein [Rhodoblastus acidophilus]MCW2318466.1 OOP family OmpA-OmpF porin [Rhodoblastus acidophilus]
MAALDPGTDDSAGGGVTGARAVRKSSALFEVASVTAVFALVGGATYLIDSYTRLPASVEMARARATTPFAPAPAMDPDTFETAAARPAPEPVAEPASSEAVAVASSPLYRRRDLARRAAPPTAAPVEPSPSAAPETVAVAEIPATAAAPEPSVAAAAPVEAPPSAASETVAAAEIPAAPAAPEPNVAASEPAATAAAPETLVAAEAPAAPGEAVIVAEAPAAPEPSVDAAAPAQTPSDPAPAPVVAATSNPAVDDQIVTGSIPPKPIRPADDLPPASFEFSTAAGRLHVSGVVADPETRAALLNALKAVHGPRRIVGAIAVEPGRASAPWLAAMPAALKTLKVSGLTVLFSGSDLMIRGYMGDADRTRLSSNVEGLFGGDVKVVSLADHLSAVSARANARVAEALAALPPGFAAADLVGALNRSVVNFASASAEAPATERALLGQAAALMAQLPQGTVIEIAGHTDGTGDEAENVALSRRRAEAVRAALIQAGARPDMLTAKGYGGAAPVVANDSVEGRFRNRRIEYRLVGNRLAGK